MPTLHYGIKLRMCAYTHTHTHTHTHTLGLLLSSTRCDQWVHSKGDDSLFPHPQTPGWGWSPQSLVQSGIRAQHYVTNHHRHKKLNCQFASISKRVGPTLVSQQHPEIKSWRFRISAQGSAQDVLKHYIKCRSPRPFVASSHFPQMGSSIRDHMLSICQLHWAFLSHEWLKENV